MRGDYAALHPHFTDVSAGLVDRIHAKRKRVNAWTVNTDVDLRRVIGMGVDGIITDDPALACRLTGRAG